MITDRAKGRWARLIAAAGPRVANAPIPDLLRMSDNVCSIQRGAAAMALAKLNPAGDRISPAVFASVYHRDPVMRSYLIATAKTANDPKRIERLKDMAENEPEPPVRAAARETLAALQAK